MTYFAKKNFDKYYTTFSSATQFIHTLYNCLSADTVSEYIEPSAGAGAFSLQLTGNVLSFDIEPEHSGITKQDFFTLPLEYKQGRCFVGNPPFGRSSHLLKKFIARSVEFGDYIAYICNSSFLKWQIPGFDLLYSESFYLDYSDVKVRTAFNVWKRNTNKIEPQSILKEFRYISRQKDGTTKGIPPNLHEYILIGAFGTGSLGRLTTDPNRWCSVAAIKLKDGFEQEHFCNWVQNNKAVFNLYRRLTPTVLNNIIAAYYMPTISSGS